MKKIKFTDIDYKPSNLDEWDVCICPADLNYSGFPLGTKAHLTASMFTWNRSGRYNNPSTLESKS
jgi:hypothetical protein